MNSRAWIGISISLILASFIAFAFLARKPLCIDSRLVERIDRVEAEKTSSIYRCSLRKSVPYDEKWAEMVLPLSRRIQAVEKLLESISPFSEKVRVLIFENRPLSFKVVNHDIFMGDEMLTKPGALEKGLFKIWFREKANSLILDHPILEESITDLLDFVMGGELNIYDPVLSRDLELSRSRWPFVVMTLPTYCKSIWRQTEHYQFCKDMNRTDLPAQVPIISSSLRPLLTEALISSYLQLSLREKKEMLESLPRLLELFDFQESGVGFTSLKEAQQSLVDLSSEMSSTMRNLERHAAEAHLQKWIGLVRQELAVRGFSEQPLVAQADLLVVLKDLAGQEFFSSNNWQEPKNKLILGYDQNKLFLLPNREGLDRSLISGVIAEKVIFFHCGPLLAADLEPYFERTTRLLAVQGCGLEKPLRLESYIDGNIDQFASQNPELKFVDIHLPSLALALRLKKIHSADRISLAATSHEFLGDKLGWKESIFDKVLNVYRVQGDIEAVRSYRP